MCPAVLILLSVMLYPQREQLLPKAAFSPCEKTGNLHVAVKQENDHSLLVHCHVKFTNMQGKSGYARLQCFTFSGGAAPEPLHTSLKVVNIKAKEEYWSFFLPAPRFASDPDALYQLDAGVFDESDVNEYKPLAPFAWKYKNKEMVGPSDRNPFHLIHRVKIIVNEGGTFRIRSAAQTTMIEGGLRYGQVKEFPTPTDGRGTATRLD